MLSAGTHGVLSPARSRWLLLPVALAVAAALLLLAAAWFSWDREAVLAWKRSASPPLFFAAMAILPALGLPLTPFYIVAGATFGVPIGLIGSMIALAVNLTLSYFIARSIPQAWLEGVLSRFGTKLPAFDETSGAIRFSVLVKLTPGVPMLLKNYLLGLSGVPFKVYLLTSLVTALLYAVPLMILGNSLFDHDWSRSTVAIVVGLAAGAGVWLWRRRSRRQ
jgi:uncharacterized membrane protein YdjX (TVP38/TMEM64 family)